MVGSMKGMKAVGRYGAIGFELLGSIAIGYYIGHWLDQRYDQHWIGLVGFVIGCYAGFKSLFRAAKNMQRDIEKDEALERGEDPWAKPIEDIDEDDATAVANAKAAIASAFAKADASKTEAAKTAAANEKEHDDGTGKA